MVVSLTPTGAGALCGNRLPTAAETELPSHRPPHTVLQLLLPFIEQGIIEQVPTHAYSLSEHCGHEIVH